MITQEEKDKIRPYLIDMNEQFINSYDCITQMEQMCTNLEETGGIDSELPRELKNALLKNLSKMEEVTQIHSDMLALMKPYFFIKDNLSSIQSGDDFMIRYAMKDTWNAKIYDLSSGDFLNIYRKVGVIHSQIYGIYCDLCKAYTEYATLRYVPEIKRIPYYSNKEHRYFNDITIEYISGLYKFQNLLMKLEEEEASQPTQISVSQNAESTHVEKGRDEQKPFVRPIPLSTPATKEDKKEREPYLLDLNEIWISANDCTSQMSQMCVSIASVGSIVGAFPESDRDNVLIKLDMFEDASNAKSDIDAILLPYLLLGQPLATIQSGDGFLNRKLLKKGWGSKIYDLSRGDFWSIFCLVGKIYDHIYSIYGEFYTMYNILSSMRLVPPEIRSPYYATSQHRYAHNITIKYIPSRYTFQNILKKSESELTQTPAATNSEELTSKQSVVSVPEENLSTTTTSKPETPHISSPSTTPVSTVSSKTNASQSTPKEPEKPKIEPLKLDDDAIAAILQYLDNSQKENKRKNIIKLTLILLLPFWGALWLIFAGIFSIIMFALGASAADIQTTQALIIFLLAFAGSVVLGIYTGIRYNAMQPVYRCRNCGAMSSKKVVSCPACAHEKPIWDKFTRRELVAQQEKTVIVPVSEKGN